MKELDERLLISIRCEVNKIIANNKIHVDICPAYRPTPYHKVQCRLHILKGLIHKEQRRYPVLIDLI